MKMLFFSTTDVNECLEAGLLGNDLCDNDNNTECFNSEGSYACICVSGYVRNGGICRCEFF